MLAVGENLLDAGTREGSTQLFLRLIGDVVVIAVEEPEEVRMEGPVVSKIFAQDESFEEPGGMGQMPFGGTGLGTALHHHVFRSERSTQREALAARRGESGQKSGRAKC